MKIVKLVIKADKGREHETKKADTESQICLECSIHKKYGRCIEDINMFCSDLLFKMNFRLKKKGARGCVKKLDMLNLIAVGVLIVIRKRMNHVLNVERRILAGIVPLLLL